MAGVALVCGIPSEPPIAMVVEALARERLPHVVWNQRAFDGLELDVRLSDDRLDGRVSIAGRAVALADVGGVYTRCTDIATLPELADAVAGDDAAADPRLRRCFELHQQLDSWLELAPIAVLNRTSAMASNGSKPYQAQVIRAAGFSIPSTLVTNDPDAARAFAARMGRVVFKAISGERTIVTELDRVDEGAFARLHRCPVQFQQYVAGRDVRVHVVGSRTFATAIDTDAGATDYRYARGATELSVFELPRAVEQRCVELAAALDLPLAGIDLRFGDDGRVYCFEVNPSPAYSYYELGTGQPIARAIARLIAGVEG